MARTGITFDEVAQAADALVAQGEQPSIRSIRAALGDTGSPNTIHRHLATWREARPQVAASAPDLPADLAAAISREIERAASHARAEIESRLVQTQVEAADLAAAGEALEKSLADATEMLEAVERERDELAGRAAEQAQEIGRQSVEIERERVAAEAARIDLAGARLKLEAQAETLIEAKTEIQTLRAALDEHRAARQAAEQSAAVLQSKLDAATERAAEIREREQAAAHRAEQMESRAREAERAHADAARREQACQARLEAAARDLETMREQLKVERANAQEAGQVAAELRGRIAQMAQQMEKSRTARQQG